MTQDNINNGFTQLDNIASVKPITDDIKLDGDSLNVKEKLNIDEKINHISNFNDQTDISLIDTSSNDMVELLKILIDGLSKWVVILEAKTFQVIFNNRALKTNYCNVNKPCVAGVENCQIFEQFRLYAEIDSENINFEYFCPFQDEKLNVKAFLSTYNNIDCYFIYVENITEKVQYHELAFYDELTGIFNRRYSINKTEELINSNKRFSFCIIDIDGLKYCNDTFGHNTGDTYIKTIVNLIKSAFLYNIFFSRLGGDEFTIISEKLSADFIEEKLIIVNKKLTSLSDKYPMSISFGAVDILEDSNMTYANIVEQTDSKMYTSKRAKKLIKSAMTPSTSLAENN